MGEHVPGALNVPAKAVLQGPRKTARYKKIPPLASRMPLHWQRGKNKQTNCHDGRASLGSRSTQPAADGDSPLAWLHL